MTAHQFALRKPGADGLEICDVDLGFKDLGYKGISDVYGPAAEGDDAPARMGILDSEKATVRA
jgi:hypothetical protein